MKYPKRSQYKHAKQKKYHVSNWAEYNEGQRRRGDLTVWFDEEAIANWKADKSGKPVSILLDRNAFAACLSMGPDRIREDALRILAPFRLRRRGVETKLVLGNPTKSVDRTLLRNIANALSWLDRIKAGKTYEQIATEDAIPTDRVRKAIRYAFLAPDIVRAVVEGRQPVGLTSSYLLHHPLPDDWEKQRVLVKTL